MKTNVEQASAPTGALETTAQRWRWRVACTAVSAAAGLNLLVWVGAVLMPFGWFVVGAVSATLTLGVWLALNRFRVLESALVWVGLPSCIFLFAKDANLLLQALPFALLGLGAMVGWTLPAVDRAQTTFANAVNRKAAKYPPWTADEIMAQIADENTKRARRSSQDSSDRIEGMSIGTGRYGYLKHKD